MIMRVGGGVVLKKIIRNRADAVEVTDNSRLMRAGDIDDFVRCPPLGGVAT